MVVLGVSVPQPVERLVRQATEIVLQTGNVTAAARAPWQSPAPAEAARR
jgi:hypothetical protein